jgi:hypothetical protein
MERRKPLKRTNSLKRTPLKRGESQMKRTKLNPVSDRRKEVNKLRKEAMLEHFGKRETWVCQGKELIGTPCFGDVNGHEILSRARSGQSDKNLLNMEGIILLCNHHNSWVEDNPKIAHELGLTKHAWEVE